MDPLASLTLPDLRVTALRCRARSLLRSASAGADGAPPWPQLPSGRTVLTHHGRGAAYLACRALGIGAGDEVLVPAYHCGAEVDAVLATGARAVLCRVDDHGVLDAGDARRRITARTRAIYAIHAFGWADELRDVRALCGEFGLPLVEDCALGLFASSGGRPAGSDADAAIFSFRKILPVPDGGALVLRRACSAWALGLAAPDRTRIARRTLGMLRPAFTRTSRAGAPLALEPGPRADLPGLPAGYLHDAAAARWTASRLTLSLIANVDPRAVAAQRRVNAARLAAALEGVPGLRLLFSRVAADSCPVALPVVVAEPAAFVTALRRCGVDAVAWWSGFHRALSWREFPEAERLKRTVVALPVHQGLGEAEIERVANAVLRALPRSAPAAAR